MIGNAKIVVHLVGVVAVFLLLTNMAQSQENLLVVKENGGMGYSMFGSATIGISDLNAKLEEKGYSTMSDNFFSVGGGGHSIINNKFIIGGEGHTLLGEEVSSGNFRNSTNITYLFANLGYVVYSIKDLRIYPLLGLGGGVMNLSIAEKTSSVSMDDILDNPKREVSISKGGFLLNLSVGIDYLLCFGQDETGRGGMLLGIRAGYTLSPFKSGWTLNDIDVEGSPEMGMSGPYVRFMIGGGGFGKTD